MREEDLETLFMEPQDEKSLSKDLIDGENYRLWVKCINLKPSLEIQSNLPMFCQDEQPELKASVEDFSHLLTNDSESEVKIWQIRASLAQNVRAGSNQREHSSCRNSDQQSVHFQDLKSSAIDHSFILATVEQRQQAEHSMI